jgi:hypothetical protein
MALTMINHHQASPTATQHRYASSNCTKHYQAPSSIHSQHQFAPNITKQPQTTSTMFNHQTSAAPTMDVSTININDYRNDFK